MQIKIIPNQAFCVNIFDFLIKIFQNMEIFKVFLQYGSAVKLNCVLQQNQAHLESLLSE